MHSFLLVLITDQRGNLPAASTATTTAESTATSPAHGAAVAIHPGSIAALIHASESSVAPKASTTQVPISDAVTTARCGITWRKPAGAALRRHTTSNTLSGFRLPWLTDSTGTAPRTALAADPARISLPGHSTSTALADTTAAALP
jgi:hypothetical protein